MEESPPLTPPPPEEKDHVPDCCFGATKRQSFVLSSVIGGILFITFFCIVMTDDHTLRYAFAMTGVILAILVYVIGIVLFKYSCIFQTTAMDFDGIRMSDTPSPVLGFHVPGGMNSTNGLGLLPQVQHDGRLSDGWKD